MINKIIQNLASQAQKETIPQVNVSDSVLSILNSQPIAMVSYKPMAWIATAATAAAACVAIAAFLSLKPSSPDVATDIYQAISWVTQ